MPILNSAEAISVTPLEARMVVLQLKDGLTCDERFKRLESLYAFKPRDVFRKDGRVRLNKEVLNWLKDYYELTEPPGEEVLRELQILTGATEEELEEFGQVLRPEHRSLLPEFCWWEEWVRNFAGEIRSTTPFEE